MKKVLENNAKTQKYLSSLKVIYIVGHWAHYGVRAHYFSGKYNKDNIPLVYEYYDGNGTCDKYVLMPIDLTTTGRIICWMFSETNASIIARALNKDGGII